MEILENLKKLAEKAYTPYSKFQVATIVVTNGGEIFEGVNVENASYPVTVCSEKIAIGAAISNGFKRFDFAEIHLYGGNGFKNILPCGSCRQFIFELFGPSKKLFSYSNSSVLEFEIGDLLPHAFTDKDL